MKLTVLLLLVISLSAKADTTDSLLSKKDNKISFEFAGGITYCNYSFKDGYDYYADAFTIPDNLKNTRGTAFELNVKIPIKKRKVFMNVGVAYAERNVKYLVDEDYYVLYEPYFKSETYRNSYLSLVLGIGYKCVETKHYLLDVNVDIRPSMFVYQKLEGEYHLNYKPKFIVAGSERNGGIPTNVFIAPVYLKINNYYKLNQHFALGINLGLFYDIVEPFYDNTTKNKINYSSNLVFRYTL